MIKYISTRGQDNNHYTFSEAILKGIADDGGLLVPETIPAISQEQMQALLGKSYQDAAEFILTQFATDVPPDALRQIINSAYGNNFDDKAITPVMHLKENLYILELWHGPTAAFKDLALQLMPLLFTYAVQRENERRKQRGEKSLHYFILVSTSGDTGKAALEGYKDKENLRIMAMYPHQRVAFLQEQQMITQEGNNVAVCAVEGDFDAVQDIAKCIFNDKAFAQKLLQQHHTVLSSANSINWGRLIPQIVYYLYGYLDLVKKNVIKLGEEIDVAVPSGNFGNILAALYAKKMGVPIKKLICAVNENHVLADFLQTGVYDIDKRSLVKTPSPSMDILVASNIERLLYLLTHNAPKVAEWMQDLKEQRRFSVDDNTKQQLQELFYADWVRNADSLTNIKNIFMQTDYLMDPHTSVAELVAERYRQQTSDKSSILVCATAHWSKFARDIYPSIKREQTNTNDFEILEELAGTSSKLCVPAHILALKHKPVKHQHKLAADVHLVENEIEKWLAE